ncbi:MAG: DUF1549 domain-containing protein [Planctomycetaceae bacterium]
MVRQATITWFSRLMLATAVSWGMASSVAAQATPAPAESLTAPIDALINANHLGPAAPPASDADFLRRLYLDLLGRVPSVTEARAFLADTSPEKRNSLVDTLMQSPEHSRRMATVLDIMLMERRGDKAVPTPEWRQYLFASYQSGKPYHQLAAEILGANGIDPAQRAQAKFYLDRDAEPNLITRDVGRVFFGMDLQCAQCHNHPLIDSYYQSDYYGLFAFVSRNFEFTQEDQNKRIVLAEKADGEVDFKSVFTGDYGRTLPKLPGDPELTEPSFPPGEEYEVKPADKVIPVPKYSRRAKFAELVAAGTNRAFQRNIANRTWAFMMGRGLVNPVDLHHLDNLATHPELLDLLSDTLAARNFDLRSLIRDIAKTQAYQRSFQMPEDLMMQIDPVLAQLPQVEANVQMIAETVKQATAAQTAAQEALSPAFKTATEKAQEALNSRAAAVESRKAVDTATAAVSEAKTMVTVKQDVFNAVKAAADQAQAAVQKLPNEPELAQAAEKFVARAAQIAVEVETLTKTVAEKEAALIPVNESHAAALKTLADVEAQLAAVRAAANQLREPFLAAKTAVERQKALERRAELQVKEIQSLLKLRELTPAVETAVASIPPIEQRLAELTTLQEQQKTDVANAEATVAAAKVVMTEKEKLVATAQTEQMAKQEKGKAVNDALIASQVALEKIPGDAVLTETVGKLKTLTDQMNQEIDTATKLVATQQAELKTAQETVATVEQTLSGIQKTLEQTVGQVAAAQQQLVEANELVKTQRTALADQNAAVTELWTKQYAVAPLKPLSPEQFVWSVMQVVGIVDQQKAAVEAEFVKNNPAPEANPNDPQYLAAKTNHVEQTVYTNLQGNVNTFVGLYGAGAGQPQDDFFATAEQALFLANGGTVDGWLNPAGGNLTERLVQQADAKLFAEELYLAVLTRMPEETEVAEVTQYLADRGEARPSAVKELVWALLTSSEFRFNH